MNLANLRSLPPDHPAVQAEFLALQAERLVEREAAKERYGYDDVNFKVACLEYKRLLTTKSLLYRLLVGAGAQALQQWTGINAIIYVSCTLPAENDSLLTASMLLRSSTVLVSPAPPWVSLPPVSSESSISCSPFPPYSGSTRSVVSPCSSMESS